MAKGVVLGILIGFVLVFLGAYLYFATGHAPVATNAPMMPLERKFAGMALHSYLDKLPHPNPQIPVDEKNMLQGAEVYKDHCAICHGLPGQPKTAIAHGMFPAPPQLFEGMGVTDDEPWETYWKVSGGIRMTGMPGFNGHLSDTEMWQVSVLLKNADKIPPAVKAELAEPPSASHMTVPPGTSAPPPMAPPATH